MCNCIQEVKKMIEEIETIRSFFDVITGDKVISEYCEESLEELIERLEKQSQNDGWIKVEDSLPDNGIDVNAFFDGEYIWRASYHKNYGGGWFFNGTTVREGRITHWHPLPNPPIS